MKKIILLLLALSFSTLIYGASFRYLTFEIYDHYAGNGATITEIKVYDDANSTLSYAPVDAYENFSGSVPMYWNSSVWSKSKLSDGILTYTSNSSGANGSAIFLCSTSANTGTWARFILDLGVSKDISKIDIWAGSPEYRVPYYIEVWGSDSYSHATNLVARDDTGLTNIDKVDFFSNQNSVFVSTVDVAPNLSGIPVPELDNYLLIILTFLILEYFSIKK